MFSLKPFSEVRCSELFSSSCSTNDCIKQACLAARWVGFYILKMSFDNMIQCKYTTTVFNDEKYCLKGKQLIKYRISQLWKRLNPNKWRNFIYIQIEQLSIFTRTFEDTKGVIKRCKTIKDRKYSSKIDLQNTTQKLKFESRSLQWLLRWCFAL